MDSRLILKHSANFILSAFMFTVCTAMQPFTAKSNPIKPFARLLAFKRAKSLDNGISVSWFEQTWNKNVLSKNGLENADFALLKKPGFKSFRLSVVFEYFENEHIPVEQLFSRIDNIVKQCGLYGFKPIICYRPVNFNENNYRSETPGTVDL